MPCPFSSKSTDVTRYFRRDVLKNALAVGGVAALAACLEEDGTPNVPLGIADGGNVPDRQYAWNEYLSRDPHGNTIFPYHQLILLLNYVGDSPPTQADREAVEDAFTTLERAFQRGNGGVDPYQPDGSNTPGVLYTMGYSRNYFEMYDDPLPSTAAFRSPESVLEAVDEEPSKADSYDAALLLTSDYAQVLLSTELALFGKLDTLNGIDVEGTLDDAFEIADRRTGFIGPGVPRRELERDEIPSRSPLAMGFISGFADNQASEDAVAIESGPFAGGTTQQISKLRLDLDEWYDLEHEDRIHLMFSPEHTEDDVGEVGEFLASDSGLTREMDELMHEHAETEGVVGHTQKLAAARNDEFEPLILRRSEAVSTDEPTPGFNFTSLQRDLDAFVDVRKAMNGDHLETDVEAEHNGILDYISVEARGTYLVPPRSLIALPPTRPES
ncbi:DUF7405 family protein [Natronoglomus mannanivorans]|uniref:DUF7405 family protein n=1 Tax=Natronoglomus mannanivorans TaxID=2979990 RepID=UPI0030832C1D